MYHEQIVQNAQEKLEGNPGIKAVFPAGLQRLPVDTCRGYVRRLAEVVDDKGERVRKLTSDEEAFIANERLLYKIDFRYGCERYMMVNKGGQKLEPLFPLWESQEIVLREMGRIQLERQQTKHPDGILLDVLKARQLGLSTFGQALNCHRVSSHSYVSSLIAGDVPDQSGYIFEMLERNLENLPWWLKPDELLHQRTGEHRRIELANKSIVRMDSGKSMRGQLADEAGSGKGKKGELGRGKTYSLVFLTELATWERPEQLDGGLFPGIPYTALTLAILESTAKGRHNWWHKMWQRAVRGTDRWLPIFIPWYAERSKYWLPASGGWIPSQTTLEHAKRCELEGPKWLRKSVRLTREQLFWYEQKRKAFEDDGRLADFLSEYPAEPEESFQFSGRSIFPLHVRERIKAQAKPLIDVWSCEPAKDIAILRGTHG